MKKLRRNLKFHFWKRCLIRFCFKGNQVDLNKGALSDSKQQTLSFFYGLNLIGGCVLFNGTRVIESNTTARIKVLDVSRIDAPAVTLGEQIILNPRMFPIYFRFFYRMRLGVENVDRYGLSVSIERGNKTLYLTDTFNSILNDNNQFMNFVSVNVIKIWIKFFKN